MDGIANEDLKPVANGIVHDSCSSSTTTNGSGSANGELDIDITDSCSSSSTVNLGRRNSAAAFRFVNGHVPRYHYTDPEGLQLLRDQCPVILTGSDLVSPALNWDLDYLSKNLGPGLFTVFSNQCSTGHKRHLFKYYDENKVKGYSGSFLPEMKKEDLSFEQFLERFHNTRNTEKIYFQQPLNSTVGKQIATDFLAFNWAWAMALQKDCKWGPLTSNLLLIGQAGNVTPCHYDEQENLFCQLQGTKTFLLFSPEQFPNLYPYPVHHPHDRQSQVDLELPDIDRFPKITEAGALEAMLVPGDVLYIPMYWWHHVINISDTVAINFWYKGGSDIPIVYPLKSRQKVAMVRNVEKMLVEALQDQEQVGTLLHWLVDGRY